jgi:predicted metalloprotease
MRIITRPRLLAGATLALALAGAIHYLGSARADERGGGAVSELRPAGTHASNLITGDAAQQQPQTMEEFLTDVTTDVDAYWEKVFAASQLPTPRVSYDWIPAGQTVASVCGGESGQLGDTAAAYCPGDDTIYISQQFASDIYDGSLDHALPGSSQGYGRTAGDFAVAYIVAHEYGHQVQDELGLFDAYGDKVPTMAFELQADCFAGTWAKSAADQDRLEDGDLQEALDAVLAVGDFDASSPGHHGTPEQREEAWKTGYGSGAPASCSRYLEQA